MTIEPGQVNDIQPGTPVLALNGENLGVVRETYPNYLLVDQQDAHNDLDVPTSAIESLVDGTLRLSVNREALTEVDHEETVHHEHGDPQG